MTVKGNLVLVVDDDVRYLRIMKRILLPEGYSVITANNGNTALDLLCNEMPQIVLLDIVMPGDNGFTICQSFRDLSSVPIIMVTAKGSDDDKLKGFDVGTDDYITKPFSSKVLLARMKAVLKRTERQVDNVASQFNFRNLTVDFKRNMVIHEEQIVNLTSTEYRLLSYLAHNANWVVTPDQILEKVWGYEYIGAVNLLQVNIGRLRKKLKDNAKKPKYIHTWAGIGYAIGTDK